MKLCTNAIEVKQIDQYFSIATNSVEIRVLFLTDSILRIRAGFDGDFAEESYSLVMTAWEDRMDELMKDQRKKIIPASAELIQSEHQAVIQGASLKVVIEKDPFRICIYDKEGTCLHSDIVDLGYQEDSNHRRIHTSEISPEDCFYGFGEKSGQWNKAQKFLSMSPKDAMGYNPKETDSLYKHIPFYVKLNRSSKKAVGYFYHNTYECDFDMGREKSNYWKPHSRYRTDGGDIDLFLIAGPSIREVVSRYTDLTGKSAMLPRYALGYLGSSMYYPELEADCDDAIAEFIDTTKEEDIPVDGFQLSSGYTSQETDQGIKRCVFTWNEKRFKNPKDFFEQMRKRGITVSPNVKPGILLSHPDLDKMKAKGIFVKDSQSDEPGIGTWWGGKGVFADFTKPVTRTVWKDLLKKNVLEMGTCSVWNDNCEYDSMVDKDCRCDFEGKGGTIGQLKSVMSNIMCHITDEAIHETFDNTRPFIVCRSGHSGIQRYAQTWAGDNLTCWDSLKYNIATILGMSLSGVANQGCDIGGFYGTSPEAELMVRWIQNGIFQPRFSVHSVNTDNTVTEPWMYGNCTGYIRDAIKFRYRLIPYLYSLMERAHETGLPIMEPMCSAFQHDARCYEEGVDFMIGDSLLVANVVEKDAVTREVYLPAGETFYDFYTREQFKGGQTVELPVTLESIPLFVREGAIIPMAANQMNNLSTETVTGIRLLLAAGKSNTFTLYEDDGTTLNYQNGDYIKTVIEMTAGEQTTVEFKQEGSYQTAVETIYLDVIHREKAPFWITLDGTELPHFLYRKKFEAAECGWYYSQTLKSVQIKYKNPKKDCKLVISFQQFDMIGM
ncbi:glycoside hydrolase family 31 protein [Clostridium boliviensis]|uniref:Glycoside hydrolase family 31 protein n=1 Tax=Clostridium boliviensis TaxID=318465 RepID=A0ABU4GJL3_9CLOT|nr:TIM-barrel domain-containing protein [Clostridium boliviensis]MDW2797800.1 glycoside hydrolase family 31 protein [Clostridium boliviensis]